MDDSPEMLPATTEANYPGVPEPVAAALVVRYQAGDHAALAELHEQLTPAILSFMRRFRGTDLPPSLTMQDLRQQSWIILAELARRWQITGSFLAYFFHSFPLELRRFVQRSYTIRRTSRVQVAMVPHDDLVLQMDRLAEYELPLEVEGLPLLEELGRVPPGPRAAFLLHVLDGHDFAAIGETLQVSRATAHRLYQQALAQLRTDTTARFAAFGTPRVLTSDIERVVWALHRLAGPDGALPGRRPTIDAAGVTRESYGACIARLEAAGAIVERAPKRAGRLVETTAVATLLRLHGLDDGEGDPAPLVAVDSGDERVPSGGGRREE